MSGGFDVLGGRGPRVDAVEKVTGRAQYTDDLTRPGLLHGALLQSPYAHARLVRLDTSRAERLPGVAAVLTARNTPRVPYGVSPARYDEQLFAGDRVRFIGDEIAAVAAVDLDTAAEALSLIRVEYEPLEPVLDALTAREPDRPQIHEAYARNVCAQVEQHFGDVDAARAGAYLVRQDRLSSKMQNAAFLEPQAALAEVDGRGRLTIWSSTQVPHYLQRTVAMVLGLAERDVHVVMPRVGGGFGAKASASAMELATCLLAQRTGRPTKTVFSREQVFLHGRSRHQFWHTMTTGVDREGRLLFLDHEALLDGGAAASFGIATIYYAGSLLGAPYRLRSMRYRGVRVVTNKPPCGAQRGHGGVHARALFETQLDRIAEELGLDPIELRLRNVMAAGETTCNDLAMSSLGMRECLEAVRDRSGWQPRAPRPAAPRAVAAEPDGLRPAGSSAGGNGNPLGVPISAVVRGRGVACGFFVSGAGYPIYRSRTPHASVVVRLDETGGGVEVQSAVAEIGQGCETVLATIAAEVLGVPVAAVRVRSGDTDLGLDLGAYSSRTTLMAGHAVKAAAEHVRDQVLAVVATALGVPPATLALRGALVLAAGAPVVSEAIRTEYVKEHRGWNLGLAGPHLTFAEAARLAFLERGPVVGTGLYRPPALGGSFKGAAVGTSPAYGCSAQIAEVRVDLDTGQVTLERVVAAHDCGRAINLTQVEGQMHGCVSMGVGEALFEEVVFGADGRIQNPSLADYRIPTALDVPPIEAIVVESDEPNGPFGAKEVGEGGIMPTIPAVLNAIYDATGVRVEELPASPERILAALRRDGGA
ncbi:MAG: molybdopterin-dependent oxidoreductase [Deltaproteobacteria bacterium]|nr:molybdopterin-dependent oxidoreductase [Deltaproteobacteria bacterium]